MHSSPLENWRPVPGYEGLYDVSDQGRVRSYRAPGRSRVAVLAEPHVLKPVAGRYLTVVLCGASGRRTWTIHKLVTLAFLGSCPKGQEVRHLNGVNVDCRLANLTYGTHQENVHDQMRHGTLWQLRVTHCPKGHPYDVQNTRYHRTAQGGIGRDCRACRRLQSKRKVA